MFSRTPSWSTVVCLARMVIPFSRSRSPESMTRSTTAWFERNVPVWRKSASTRVVLPWSTWATIATLRRSARTAVGVAEAAESGTGVYCSKSNGTPDCPMDAGTWLSPDAGRYTRVHDRCRRHPVRHRRRSGRGHARPAPRATPGGPGLVGWRAPDRRAGTRSRRRRSGHAGRLGGGLRLPCPARDRPDRPDGPRHGTGDGRGPRYDRRPALAGADD